MDTDESGNVVGPAAPWWQQVYEDLLEMSEHSALDSCMDEIRVNSSVLFTDAFIRDTFLLADPKILEAKPKSAAMSKGWDVPVL